VRKVGAEPRVNSGSRPKGQGGLILRILRRMLMILVMVVLRTRPQAIRKVFDSLETEGILGIELGVNSAKGKIYIVLGGGHDDLDGGLDAIKLKIPSFLGKNDLEEYLEWEKKVDWIFDCHNNYSEVKKVLVVIEFTNYTLIWWNQNVISRRKSEERPVVLWEEIKVLMRRRFVPNHDYRDLYLKLQGLNQGLGPWMSISRRWTSQ